VRGREAAVRAPRPRQPGLELGGGSVLLRVSKPEGKPAVPEVMKRRKVFRRGAAFCKLGLFKATELQRLLLRCLWSCGSGSCPGRSAVLWSVCLKQPERLARRSRCCVRCLAAGRPRAAGPWVFHFSCSGVPPAWRPALGCWPWRLSSHAWRRRLSRSCRREAVIQYLFWYDDHVAVFIFTCGRLASAVEGWFEMLVSKQNG